MERRAAVLALALTLPLAFYGIPYAYAVTTSSSYRVFGPGVSVASGSDGFDTATCHAGDYVTGGGYLNEAGPGLVVLESSANSNTPPNAWIVSARNPTGSTLGTLFAEALCQTPVTVAGIGVPQFGSLYVAIALGALVYFMLSRRYVKRPTIQA